MLYEVITERAATGTDIAHDHEGGGTVAETFAQVGAARLFADRGQLVLAQLGLDPLHLGVGAHAHTQPIRLARHLV